MRPASLRVLAGLLALFLAGCAAVRPYEKEHLADPIMHPRGAELEHQLDEHIAGDREGAALGGGGSGGGCGC